MEKDAGWIALSRKITESWVWEDAQRFQRWVALLLEVNFEDTVITKNGHSIAVPAGATAMSVRRLAVIWDCSKSVADRFLNELVTNEMIDFQEVIVNKRLVRIIVVTNWNKYQQKSNNLKVNNGVGRKLGQDVGRKLGHVSENSESPSAKDSQQKTVQCTDRKLGHSTELKVAKNADNVFKNTKKEEENQLAADKSRASRRAEFVAWWNKKMQNAKIPKIRLITDERAALLNNIQEHFRPEDIGEVVNRAAYSPFLNGGGKKHFVATFDWVFNEKNFLKILEGNYNPRSWNRPLAAVPLTVTKSL